MKKTIAVLALVMVLGLSVQSAEAKAMNGKAKGRAEVSVEAKEKVRAEVKAMVALQATSSTSTAPCVKPAWGHLFAKGWLKKFTKPAQPACAVPPGIAKKIGMATSTPTSTPDIVAPIISGVTTTQATSSITVRWNTNEAATGKLYVSTTSPVNTSTATVVMLNALSTVHMANLAGLTPNTTYHFLIEAKDAAGNTTLSGQQSVTTGAWDATPPVIGSTTVSNVASTSASVAWTTNEPATGKITYATSSSLTGGSSILNNILTANQSVNLTGLSASTTYYFALEAKDANGNTATSSVQSFTTLQ